MNIDYLADHPVHVPTIGAWHHAQFGYLSPSLTLEDRIERVRSSLQKKRLPITIIALSDAGSPLGSASIFPTTITHKHLTPWLSSVYVPPEHRGRGTASVLSLHAVAVAAQLGYEKLYLFTPHSEALYARIGWTTFDRAEHNGQEIVLMERPTEVVRSSA